MFAVHKFFLYACNTRDIALSRNPAYTPCYNTYIGWSNRLIISCSVTLSILGHLKQERSLCGTYSWSHRAFLKFTFPFYEGVYIFPARCLSLFLLGRMGCQHTIFTLSWPFTRSTANLDRNLAFSCPMYRLAPFLMSILEGRLAVSWQFLHCHKHVAIEYPSIYQNQTGTM
jgi:hypothetical protein